MNILITGISGRIGSLLAEALLEQGNRIRGLIWPRDPGMERLRNLPIDIVEGSLTHREDLNRAVENIDAVYHLGAAFQAGGPFTPQEIFDINVGGTFHLLEALREEGAVRHLFFASSDALYNKYLPQGMDRPIEEETTPVAPGGLYALSKQLGENLCQGYLRNHAIPITIFRFAMTLGGAEILTWPQFYARHWLMAYGDRDDPEERAVRQRLEMLVDADPNHLIIARDGNGRPFRKHIAHTFDIVAGLVAGLGCQDAIGQTIQLAAPRAFGWDEAVPYLGRKLDLPWAPVDLVGLTPTYYEFDLGRARTLLGFEPAYDILRMIDEAA